jgi:outer membrane protein, heavy metal efflux system
MQLEPRDSYLTRCSASASRTFLSQAPTDLRTTRDSMTMKRIALIQEWVPSQKRELRTAAANAVVSREGALVGVAAAETRLQTALAFLDAYYGGASLKLGLDNEHHAREAADTARARLAAGVGNAQDLLALTAAQGMAVDDVGELRQQVASANANLARWTGSSQDELTRPALAIVPADARPPRGRSLFDGDGAFENVDAFDPNGILRARGGLSG